MPLRRSPIWSDPRVKPPYGSVELDEGHPLAQGLIFYAPLTEGAGGPVNIVKPYAADGVVGSWQPSSVSRTGFKTAVSGDYLKFPSSADYDLNGDYAFTIAWRFTKTGQTASAVDGYVGHRTSNTTGMWAVYDDNTNINFVSHSGANFLFGGGTKPTNALHTIGIVRQAGGGWTMYSDGLAVSTNGNAVALNAGPQELFVGALGGDTTTLNIFANWDWVGIWYKRALTAYENFQLHSEPYAFLRPIIRRRYSVPTGAGSGRLLAGERNRLVRVA